MPRKIVTFIKAHGRYNAGEVAGFDEHIADRMIEAKVAKSSTKAERERGAAKPLVILPAADDEDVLAVTGGPDPAPQGPGAGAQASDEARVLGKDDAETKRTTAPETTTAPATPGEPPKQGKKPA
ncbi:hypothetical protein [Pseudoroseicyclus aestuarii]|uniref:Uncharacterized protein n=1 Tax=Pseudoroseicyclus aestuarii TaxID=1795041 RepID=A0A318SSF9_9RHOB|nr:hypothetical protein [Pseudoroseicyclus aestuarii]PYE80820.1 hypothetical protein DFP88_11130 [Pseudoroseicyclus aestuarii]